MPPDKAPFQVKPFPLSRRLVIDSARVSSRQHTMTALVEVDVTRGRAIIRQHKAQTGESISFTAFILGCLGQAVETNKYMHARRDFGGRMILFDEVDCTALIEIDLEGRKFPLAHIIRSINRRTCRSIHDEIRAVQADPHSSPSLRSTPWYFVAFLLLPALLRDLFYAVLARSPQLFKRSVGTIQVSSVGVAGSGSGWGIGPGSIYTTSVILGGIAEKPAVFEGQITPRELLSLTLTFDHDIVDGAPAARFTDRFKSLIENAYGLDDLAPHPA